MATNALPGRVLVRLLEKGIEIFVLVLLFLFRGERLSRNSNSKLQLVKKP